MMKKDSSTQFIVAVLVPGLLSNEIDAKTTFIQDGQKPVLLISGQSASREFQADFLSYGYNFFQQYILLPDDVEMETFTSKMQDGLFVCSFHKKN